MYMQSRCAYTALAKPSAAAKWGGGDFGPGDRLDSPRQLAARGKARDKVRLHERDFPSASPKPPVRCVLAAAAVGEGVQFALK